MHLSKKQKSSLAAFDGFTLSGLVLWVLCVQYYIFQAGVALAWKMPFSLTHNTISDLGNTFCGPYGTRIVCSPLHDAMNVSFIILGLLMGAGAKCLYLGMAKSRALTIGLSCIAIAGVGSVLVGLFPENTVSAAHVTGAALSFVFGNIGLVAFGFARTIPKGFRLVSLCLGSIAFVALVLFLTHHYAGLDIGGMERIVAYPQSLWLIAFGLYELGSRMKAKR